MPSHTVRAATGRRGPQGAFRSVIVETRNGREVAHHVRAER
jgi:hypothetical protein